MSNRLNQLFIIILLVIGISGCAQFQMLNQLAVKPKLEVTDFTIHDASILQQSINIRLKVENPNTFALPVLGLDYDVAIAGVQVAEGSSLNSVSIPAGGSDYLDLVVNTNLLKTVPDLSNVLLKGGKNVPYTVSGSLKTDKTFISSVPFTKTGQLELKL